MKIKVCGMRDMENIRQLVDVSPDFIGFIFYEPSQRFAGMNFQTEQRTLIPQHIKKVGVFVNERPEKIKTLCASVPLDLVQLHGDESEEYCKELFFENIPLIKSFGVAEDFDFYSTEGYLPYCSYFLFDAKTPERGGGGVPFNWDKLKEYPFDPPFFLSGGIGPDDAEKIKQIKIPGLFAVDINSRFETSPGLKDIKKIKEFINLIHV